MNNTNYLNEQLKNILLAIEHYGRDVDVAIFYVEMGWKNLYQHFEVLKHLPPKYDEILANPVLKNQINEYELAKKEDRLIPGYHNIIPDGYSYEIMNIVDALYEIASLIMKSYTTDSIVVNTHLWLNKKTAYWLSKELNKSKQLISHFMNSKKPWPQYLKNDIARILNFDVSEFDQRDFGKFKYEDKDACNDDYYTTLSFEDFCILFAANRNHIIDEFEDLLSIKDFVVVKTKGQSLRLIKDVISIEDNFNFWKLYISYSDCIKIEKNSIERLYYVKY